MITEIFLFVVLFALVWFNTRKPSSMPPGSYGWPLLGTLPSSKISLTDHFSQLRQKYGSIFTTKWGVHPIVVMSDSNLIKKAFQHPDFQGRPQFTSLKLFQSHENRGIIVSEGTVWAENRRFVLRQLRDLGMGKTALEASMQEEGALLIDYLEKTCLDMPAVMDYAINTAVVNVIWQLLASKRYDINDPEALEYNKYTEDMIEVINTKLFLLDIFPVLHTVLPKFVQNKYMKVDQVVENLDGLYKMSKRIVLEHQESLNPDQPRDVIDQFILQKGDQKSSFSLAETDMNNLIGTMTDMFIAGSETTASTLRWMILYMAAYPEVQTKVQKYLDEVVPSSRLPSLGDRSQLPYVDAMLQEVLRMSSLFPLGVFHSATADVSFEGYIIPKDTVLIACHRLCHRDSSAWEKSDEFNPERFLKENGELLGKKDNFLPFSLGRRQCLGESLARMELYLFGTAILQRFRIEPPEGVTLSLEGDPHWANLHPPRKFEVVLRKRK